MKSHTYAGAQVMSLQNMRVKVSTLEPFKSDTIATNPSVVLMKTYVGEEEIFPYPSRFLRLI